MNVTGALQLTRTLRLDHGTVRTEVTGGNGNGGNIGITANTFIGSFDSLVSASSQKAVSGIISIGAPKIDSSATSAVQPQHQNAVDQRLGLVCVDGGGERRFTLSASGRGGLAQTVESSLPSLYWLDQPIATSWGPARDQRVVAMQAPAAPGFSACLRGAAMAR